jgi:hypothetical protein
VEGFTGTTPNLVFVSKSTETANLCGEKIDPATLAQVVDTAGRDAPAIKQWCVVVDNEHICYNFCIETETSVPYAQLADLATALEHELHENTPRLYRIFRRQKLIAPAQATLMKPGWYAAWRKTRTRDNDAGNQLKMPLICDSIPLPQYIQKTTRRGDT